MVDFAAFPSVVRDLMYIYNVHVNYYVMYMFILHFAGGLSGWVG